MVSATVRASAASPLDASVGSAYVAGPGRDRVDHADDEDQRCNCNEDVDKTLVSCHLALLQGVDSLSRIVMFCRCAATKFGRFMTCQVGLMVRASLDVVVQK